MSLHYLVRGMALGFSIAAPVGPIGVLCIRRTLASGRLFGFVSGLGAATADMLYGAVAAFGLTSVSSLLMQQAVGVHVIGAVFLGYLGIKAILAAPAHEAARAAEGRLASAYLSTLLLTLTNPLTIFSFVAIFAGLGIASAQANYGAASATVVGVFCGSALWWLVLSGGVSIARGRFTQRAMRWVNRISGGILIIFAVLALLSA